MKTYLIVMTSLIIAIFATTAGASPQHGDQQGHKRDQRQEHRQDHAQSHRQDRHQGNNHGQQGKKHSSGHDHRDEHRVASHHQKHQKDKHHHDKHHQNKHHTTHVREVHREVVTYHPQRVVRPRTDVSWNINVGWAPAYPNHGHAIYYQRRANGQCFRVEERVDRTVWIEVPYYKCP